MQRVDLHPLEFKAPNSATAWSPSFGGCGLQAAVCNEIYPLSCLDY